MKYIITFGLIITVAIVSVFGQQNERDANFHFKQMNYIAALKLYKTLQEKDTANIEFNYRLGICYLNCNADPSKAYKYLQKAEEKYSNNAQYQLDLAKAYLLNYDYSNCRQAALKALNLEGKNDEVKTAANIILQHTENAERMVRNPLDISFINLGKAINSEMDELTPILTPDNEILFYTSNRAYDSKFKIYTYDIYSSVFEDGNFKKGRPASTINSFDDEFVAGMSNSGERFFYQLQGYDAFEDLLVSDIINENLKGKSILNETVNSKAPERGAAETESGDTLFFSSEREEGMGGSDLYYSLKLPTGAWSEARNLGKIINSEYDEDFPVLSPDGTRLFFCSNGSKSMGGFDVFVSEINPTTREFSEPKNLGFPLNDVYDNKTIGFADNGTTAYVSAFRPDGMGFTDLYRVVFNQNDPSVKIYQVKISQLINNQPTDFGTQDSTLKVSVLNKSKHLFGTYAYDQKSSQATVALPPGTYYLEISGAKIEPYSMKISVPEIPGSKKIEVLNAVLQIKNQ